MSIYSGLKRKVARRVDLPVITDVITMGACCFFFLRAWFNARRLTAVAELTDEQELRSKLYQLCPKPLDKSLEPLDKPNGLIDISIIIPVYNAAVFLKQSIDSVLKQKTHARLEVICINDGSTDNSNTILDKLAKTDSRIKVIHQANGGASSARNTGITMANGSYLMFLDSDDILLPDTLDFAYRKIVENDADILIGEFVSFTNKIPELINQHYSAKIRSVDSKQAYYEIKDGFACGKLYKRSLWENVRFPNGYMFEDTITKPLLFRLAKKIIVTKMPLFAYRVHSSSATVKLNTELYTGIFAIWLVEHIRDQSISLELPLDELFELLVIQQLTRIINMRSKHMPPHIHILVFQYIRSIACEFPLMSVGSKLEKKAWSAVRENNIRKWYLFSQLSALEL